MNVAVLNGYLSSADNVNESSEVSTEVHIIRIIGKVERNVDHLIAEALLEKELLVCDLDTLIAACSEGRVSAIDASELDDVLVELDVLALHIRKVETGTEVIVRIVLLAALNAVFAAVVDRRDTGHRVHEGIDEGKVSLIYEGARKAVHIVVVNEVIEVDIPVNTAVHAGLAVY